MSLSEDLLDHAGEILFPRSPNGPPGDVEFRRSVSASYYALFHRLTGDATTLIAPNVSMDVNYRIQRWFDHAEMKKVCGRFAKQRLDQPLLSLIGAAAPTELQAVASSFVLLQQARHGADYDLAYQTDFDEAQELFITASAAIEAWSRIAATAEANVFILSLLLWKNWDRDRP